MAVVCCCCFPCICCCCCCCWWLWWWCCCCCCVAVGYLERFIYPIVWNGVLYFRSCGDKYGCDLYKFANSNTNITLAYDINPDGDGLPSYITEFNSTLLCMSAVSHEYGNELACVSIPTAEATTTGIIAATTGKVVGTECSIEQPCEFDSSVCVDGVCREDCSVGPCSEAGTHCESVGAYFACMPDASVGATVAASLSCVGLLGLLML